MSQANLMLRLLRLSLRNKKFKQCRAAGKALLSLKTAERHVLASRFRNAHAVAKRGRLTDSVWLCEAMAAQGVDVGSTYLNEKACAKLLTFIADAETDKRGKLRHPHTFQS